MHDCTHSMHVCGGQITYTCVHFLGTNTTNNDQLFNFTDLFEIRDATNYASLNNVKVAIVSKQCHPQHLKLQSQVFAHQQVMLPGMLELHNLSISVTMETIVQTVLIHIVVRGEWLIGSRSVTMNLTYIHNSNEFSLSGMIDNTQQGIEDLVDKLTTLSIPIVSRLALCTKISRLLVEWMIN